MKDRSLAAFLAFFFGTLGVHKYYLNRPIQGFLYVCFCWTYIPTALGIIEAIRYILMSDESFNRKYNPLLFSISQLDQKDSIKPNKTVSSDLAIPINTIGSSSTLGKTVIKEPEIKIEVSKVLDTKKNEIANKDRMKIVTEDSSNKREIVNIPDWNTTIYSYNDLKLASNDILLFYSSFKDSFLKEQYLDLKGNKNYALTLVYDFELSYLEDNDYEKLKNNYGNLIKQYPITELECFNKLEKYKIKEYPINEEIEVVTEIEKIDIIPNCKEMSIPYWSIQYIYSNKEINSASKEVQNFYYKFKSEFKENNFIQLGKDNLSYVFTLLFDLEQEYLENKDYEKLKQYYKKLHELYPKVYNYAINILRRHASSDNSPYDDNYNSIIENNNRFSWSTDVNNYTINTYNLGNTLKEKFNLKPIQVTYLNRLGYYSPTSFNQADFCYKQQCLAFCKSIADLEKNDENREKTLSIIIDEIAFLLRREVSKSYSYQNPLEYYKYIVYRYLFKITENKARDFYQHKRKLNIDTFSSNIEVMNLFQTILDEFEISISKQILLCKPADLESEFVLNSQNTTRWKSKFDSILERKLNIEEFRKEIEELTFQNDYNPSLENIFYEASKYIANKDKILALEYYLKYIKADLASATINNKPLNKTTLKVLFKEQTQLDEFNQILDEFIKTSDIDYAISKLEDIYKIKRKKIKLDIDKIDSVKKQLDSTVELLNEYLEEFEDSSDHELDTSVLEELTTKPKEENLFNQDLLLESYEVQLLQMIKNFDFLISREVVEEFASENGVFADSLINNINEKVYDLLDDNLIEEQDEMYTIDITYYKNILK
ncbi:NINE protein [Myroides marinus]|uniref:tellurite resistance TerB C-terminal domain-containing protein n=1 Tax=Myroides marinus TaxID=703342 RepID=UPI002575EF32|nr:tellurite resistance TerB C-terminal domain-containing protein [Myroides marinus]MDM1350951.1 NINE protein [Myroides marinus]MDM1358158.1 NINE protein [Myroides marinus]